MSSQKNVIKNVYMSLYLNEFEFPYWLKLNELIHKKLIKMRLCILNLSRCCTHSKLIVIKWILEYIMMSMKNSTEARGGVKVCR